MRLRALAIAAVLIAASLPVFPLALPPNAPVPIAEAAATPASAQDGMEPTIDELVFVIQFLRGVERTRELLGIQDPGRTAELNAIEHELRARAFWDVVFPELVQAEGDCSFGEAALIDAVNWARQVQIAEPEGWEEEIDVVNESMLKIVRNCHDEVYRRCVLEDRPPWPDVLASLNRDLEKLGSEEQVYKDRREKCFFGWGGTLTATEKLDAPRHAWDNSSGGEERSAYWSGSGSFEMHLERHSHQSTGDATGMRTVVSGGSITTGGCRLDTEGETIHAGTGAGQALLQPSGSPTGEFRITFQGPQEARTERAVQTRGQTTCGAATTRQPQQRTLPDAKRAGEIVIQKDDLYDERLNGEVIDIFRYDQRGGFAALFKDSGPPWLGTVAGLGVPPQVPQPPTITVTIRYDLTFGG
jgi:hypothetical protein